MTLHEKQRLVTRAVVTAILGLVTVYVAFLLIDVLLVVYVSVLLAVGFSPIVHWIERMRFSTRRLRMPRWMALLILYVAAMGIVGIGLALLVPRLVSQFTDLQVALPGLVDQLQDALVQRGLIQQRYTWSEIASQMSGAVFGAVLDLVQGAVGALGAIVTVMILPFYLLLESKDIRRTVLNVVSEENRPHAGRIMHSVTTKVGAWLGGQLLLCGVIAVTASIGLALIGVPYFYVLGLLAGAGELIPVVGPILASAPGVFMGWTVSTNTALLALAYYALQQVVENSVLVPRIMEKQVGMSASVILISLLIGSTLFGFIGALLAVPTAAIVQVFVQEYFERGDN